MEVNPWFTLGLDIAVTVALLTFPIGRNVTRKIHWDLKSFFVRGTLSATLVAIAIYGQSRFVRTEGSDEFGKLAVLDPASWPGKPFTLINEVKIEGDLSQGSWEVLLFRHNCQVCHDVIRQIERTPQEVNLAKTALVAINGLESDELIDRLSDRGCKVGHLSQNREWFAMTPLRISVRDGICLDARVIEQWDW
jgi:hypothetical protein